MKISQHPSPYIWVGAGIAGGLACWLATRGPFGARTVSVLSGGVCAAVARRALTTRVELGFTQWQLDRWDREHTYLHLENSGVTDDGLLFLLNRYGAIDTINLSGTPVTMVGVREAASRVRTIILPIPCLVQHRGEFRQLSAAFRPAMDVKLIDAGMGPKKMDRLAEIILDENPDLEGMPPYIVNLFRLLASEDPMTPVDQ
jgi:hypothetical protein